MADYGNNTNYNG